MQPSVGAASRGIRTGRLTDFGGPERGRTLRFRLRPNWLESGALGLVYLVSLASLAGFATFAVHPELLQRSGVSAETYGRILVVAPRAQILIAMAALVALLARRGARRDNRRPAVRSLPVYRRPRHQVVRPRAGAHSGVVVHDGAPVVRDRVAAVPARGPAAIPARVRLVHPAQLGLRARPGHERRDEVLGLGHDRSVLRHADPQSRRL